MPHQKQGGPESGVEMRMRLMTAQPVSLERSGEERPEPAEEDISLSRRDEALAKAYRRIKDDHGTWPKPASGYEPRSMRGRKCKGCLFYNEQEESRQGSCDLVEGPVNAEGVCDLYIDASNE